MGMKAKMPRDGKLQCAKCKQWKLANAEYFYVNRRKPSGFSSCCKDCDRKKIAQYRENNIDAIRERSRVRMREKRKNDPDFAQRQRDSARRYYHNVYKHDPKTKERARINYIRWAEKTGIREKRTLSQRKRREDVEYRNRENARRRELIKKESYRRRRRIAQQQYKARKLGASGSHTNEDIMIIYRRQKGRCYWCQRPLEKQYHVDHRIPLSRGGSNDASNLVISCAFCNQSKSDKMPWEWNGRLL